MTALPSLPSLAELLRRAAVELPPAQLPDFVAALEASRFIAYQRTAAPAPIAATAPASPAALVDADTMAVLTHLPASWIRDRARRGKLPVVRLWRYMRFQPSAVIAALEADPPAPIRRRRRRKATAAQDLISCTPESPTPSNGFSRQVSTSVHDSAARVTALEVRHG